MPHQQNFRASLDLSTLDQLSSNPSARISGTQQHDPRCPNDTDTTTTNFQLCSLLDDRIMDSKDVAALHQRRCNLLHSPVTAARTEDVMLYQTLKSTHDASKFPVSEDQTSLLLPIPQELPSAEGPSAQRHAVLEALDEIQFWTIDNMKYIQDSLTPRQQAPGANGSDPHPPAQLQPLSHPQLEWRFDGDPDKAREEARFSSIDGMDKVHYVAVHFAKDLEQQIGNGADSLGAGGRQQGQRSLSTVGRLVATLRSARAGVNEYGRGTKWPKPSRRTAVLRARSGGCWCRNCNDAFCLPFRGGRCCLGRNGGHDSDKNAGGNNERCGGGGIGGRECEREDEEEEAPLSQAPADDRCGLHRACLGVEGGECQAPEARPLCSSTSESTPNPAVCTVPAATAAAAAAPLPPAAADGIDLSRCIARQTLPERATITSPTMLRADESPEPQRLVVASASSSPPLADGASSRVKGSGWRLASCWGRGS